MVTMNDVRSELEAYEPNYRAAARRFGPDALPYLRELASGDDVMLAAKAVGLAGEIGGDEALPIIEQAAGAEAAELRVVAAAAAGRLGQDAEGIVVDLLQDGDVGVRKYAVRTAAIRPSPRVRAALEQVRAGDPDTALRRQADDALTDS
jgi:hypothetical protein